MKARLLAFVSTLLLCSCGGTSNGAQSTSVPYSPSIGPYGITTETLTITDASRGWDDNGTTRATREIPIKMYAPDASVPGAFPVVLVSHGLGGNADEAVAYMAEHLAAQGYIVVAVQHHRSDSEYLQELILNYGATQGWNRFLAAAGELETRQLRPQDMIFVLDWLSIDSSTDGYIVHGRMDLSKVGVLGHSFGAWTTLACLGQACDGTSVSDPRFLCGVAYSPQGTGTFGLAAGAWSAMTRPTFTMGGTNDTSPGTSDATDRRVAFDAMPANGTKYHATLLDAEHSDFGNGSDGFYHEWIKQMTLAFFDAKLRGDAGAKIWLDSKGIEGVSSGYVSLEAK